MCDKIRISRALIESVELKYYINDQGSKPIVEVHGYITVVRYDLWHQYTGEDLPSDGYYTGKASARPPKHRFGVKFGFSSKQNCCSMHLFKSIDISNRDEIRVLVYKAVHDKFKGQNVLLF